MSENQNLTPEEIRKALGAESVVPLPGLPSGGPLDLLALRRMVQKRLQSSGGRRTDPSWSLTRPIRFSAERWTQLERFADALSEPRRKVSPGQLGAILVEKGILALEDALEPETSRAQRLRNLNMDAQSAAIRHGELEEVLLRGKALGTLSPDSEDALIGEMDELWRAMTEEDRSAAAARIAEAKRIQAQAGRDYRDAFIPEGAHRLPREAA
ncbi:MAG: hypothetical protein AAB215_03110 [Planctomycetota bacterium]